MLCTLLKVREQLEVQFDCRIQLRRACRWKREMSFPLLENVADETT